MTQLPSQSAATNPTTGEPQGVWGGIVSLLHSRKFLASVLSTALAYLPLFFAPADMTREARQSLWEKTLIATAGIWGIYVGGTAMEDAAAKKDSPSVAQQQAAQTAAALAAVAFPSLQRQSLPEAGETVKSTTTQTVTVEPSGSPPPPPSSPKIG